MPVARVQFKRATSGPAGSGSVTFTGSPTSGNSVILMMFNFETAVGQTYTVADGGFNAFAVDAFHEGPDGFNAAIASAHNIVGGHSTITCTGSSANNFYGLVAIEYSGLAISTVVDGTPTAQSGTGAGANPGAITTVGDGLFVAINYGAAIGADPGGCTIVDGDGSTWSVAEKFTGGAGTYNLSWASSSGSWTAAASAYKIAAGGGGVNIKPRLLILGVG